MRSKTIGNFVQRKRHHIGLLTPGANKFAVGDKFDKTAATPSKNIHSGDLDKEYLTRALSHDVSAHLMVLEFSFRRYDQLVKHLSEPHSDRKIIRPHENRLERSVGNSSATNTRQGITLHEAGEHVSACLSEMKRFVDELISFAKTGSIDMESTNVSVGEVVCESLFEQQQLLNSRKIEVTMAPLLPQVWANRLRVKQIVTNLVRNAAIHGCDKDLPKLTITSELQSDGKLASFCVTDNGHGIPESERTRIFEPGYRLPGNQNEGSGIGLAIVKKIAAYYGGNVVCDSGVNGTTFRVSLPTNK
ncbi:MAG: HAMP domain-containing histidine kinase [Planctomycetaceae bacterium]|jgi:signal transduction histidine kinase|nr:HAMP domain-containing histidine kinase [Planctomycetaceae bacterium]